MVCDAENDVRYDDCQTCGQVIRPGAEARNAGKEKIGKYEGFGLWEYDAQANGISSTEADKMQDAEESQVEGNNGFQVALSIRTSKASLK